MGKIIDFQEKRREFLNFNEDEECLIRSLALVMREGEEPKEDWEGRARNALVSKEGIDPDDGPRFYEITMEAVRRAFKGKESERR